MRQEKSHPRAATIQSLLHLIHLMNQSPTKRGQEEPNTHLGRDTKSNDNDREGASIKISIMTRMASMKTSLKVALRHLSLLKAHT